jgi:hypothetical protein
MVPYAPLTRESPGLELIFSTRVPVRIAAEDCSVWERGVDVIKSPYGFRLSDGLGWAAHRVISLLKAMEKIGNKK